MRTQRIWEPTGPSSPSIWTPRNLSKLASYQKEILSQVLKGGVLRTFFAFRISASLLLPLVLVSPAQAQSILVRVVDSETNGPIQGAFVTLSSESGERMRSALTDGAGKYLFGVPEPGRYAVRAEMIGRESRQSEWLTISSEGAEQAVLALPFLPIALEGITAEGSSRCAVSLEDGALTAQVWEEARKALEVAAWALGEELYRYRVSKRVREYEPDGRVVRTESTRVSAGFFRQPFESRSAEELAAEGYVQQGEDGPVAFAPDAAVLLSNPFLNTHCFSLRRDREGGRVGLVFEPVEQRGVSDIEGVMWLDEDGLALRSVDFRYTGSIAQGSTEDPGGEVNFERLPTGAWIVGSWRIRSPIWEEVEMVYGRQRVFETVLAGHFEEGGEVLSIRDLRGQPVSSADRGLLVGTVFDSAQGGPLAGARVALEGTAWEARTDEMGGFEIPNLLPGSYILAVSHPELDLLGIRIPPTSVSLEKGQTTWVSLATRDPAAIPPKVEDDLPPVVAQAREAARPRTSTPNPTRTNPQGEVKTAIGGEGSGQVVGRVVDFDTGGPLGDVLIRLVGIGRVQATNEQGYFLFEGLDPGAVLIRAEALGRASVEDSIQVSGEALSRVEIRLPVDPISLDEILVSVEMRDLGLSLAGFYERRDATNGTFISGEDIEEISPHSTLDLFESQPGTRVVSLGGFGRSVILTGDRALSFSPDAACWPGVWLDGQMLMQGGGQEPPLLDDLINPSAIVGIEIYNNPAAVPFQFNLAGACGVIVIWTR